MNTNNDMQQTINELYKIQDRWNEYITKETEYNALETKEQEAEQQVVKKWANIAREFDTENKSKLPARATCPAGWAKTIPTPVLVDWAKPTLSILLSAIFGFLSTAYGVLAAIALSIVGFFIGRIISFIPFIGMPIGIIIVLFFFILLFSIFLICSGIIVWADKEKNISFCIALSSINKENAEWESQFNAGITEKAIENFYKEFKNYDTAFLAYVESCNKKTVEILSDYSEEINATSIKYLEMKQAKLDEITPILNELSNHPLLHSDYVSHAAQIAGLIESGRADSLKEAINLMLDDNRKDREEEERREEARRQEAENHRHNMAMQRIAEQEARDAQAHNMAMEKAAREQADAAKAQSAAIQAAANDARTQAKRAEREKREQEHKAHSETVRRCNSCANAAKCTVKFTNANCAAFRPR